MVPLDASLSDLLADIHELLTGSYDPAIDKIQLWCQRFYHQLCLVVSGDRAHP